MTNPTIALKQYLSNIGLDGDADFLHDSILLMTKILIELEAEEQIGAEKRERTSMSNKHHNGYRPRSWETRVGEIDLRIPKLRKGSFYPSLLEPRRRSEKALLAVVQKAYIEGVSTRKVDDRLKALGLIGIDKNKVSLICKELDEVVENIYNLIRAYFPRTKNEFRWPPEDHSLTGLEKRLDIHDNIIITSITSPHQRLRKVLIGIYPLRATEMGRSIGLPIFRWAIWIPVFTGMTS